MLNLDFRSDTVTKPTKEMMEAMFSAEVGDDVFQQDPTVNALQDKVAKMFGMEDALFCCSGTQTNQIAISVHNQPGDEVICDKMAHIYVYEGGGISRNAGASVKLLDGVNGIFTGDDVRRNYNNPDDIHLPLSKMVSIENTMNKGGGVCWTLDQMLDVKKACDEKGLILHLDGARVFNAIVKEGYSPAQLGEIFDSISICLSKGLGCPIGSVLIGNKEFIKKSRRVRKSLGGGMRQAGFLAAAAIYALDNQVDRLQEDHDRASRIESVLSKVDYVQSIKPVETNLVIFKLKNESDNDTFKTYMDQLKIQIVSMGEGYWRITTHLDVNDSSIDFLIESLDGFKKRV